MPKRLVLAVWLSRLPELELLLLMLLVLPAEVAMLVVLLAELVALPQAG